MIFRRIDGFLSRNWALVSIFSHYHNHNWNPIRGYPRNSSSLFPLDVCLIVLIPLPGWRR